jgi:uncharacterized protein (DUF58 family)
VAPTVSGVLLIGISFGVGLAAYNAANNILFITLSLLLACLVASGVLSWLNFRGLQWQLAASPPMRVGLDAAVTLRLRNDKRLLPTYGLWFDLTARNVEAGGRARAETTFTARGGEVRAALTRASRVATGERLYLRARLDPGAESGLEWSFQPPDRGRLRLELRSVGSLFPFGFLRKDLTTTLVREVVVWPAPVPYRQGGVATAQRTIGAERVPRTGSGDDLFALRRYELGDSHRLIHWKASARTRELLVRQFVAEAADGFALWLNAAGLNCSGPAQFELLLGFAVTLAEDLFRAGRLRSVALNAASPQPVRRAQELANWIDAVSLLPAWTPDQAATTVPAATRSARTRNLITFVPDGPRGAAALVDGAALANA